MPHIVPADQLPALLSSSDVPPRLTAVDDDEARLRDGVAPGFIRHGLRSDASVVVITATPNWERYVRALAGEDVARALARGRLVRLDADATMEAAGQAIKHAGLRGRPVRVLSEMSALLWEAGKAADAVQLEEHCGTVASQLAAVMLCTYRANLFALLNAGNQVENRLCGGSCVLVSDLDRLDAIAREAWTDLLGEANAVALEPIV